VATATSTPAVSFLGPPSTTIVEHEAVMCFVLVVTPQSCLGSEHRDVVDLALTHDHGRPRERHNAAELPQATTSPKDLATEQ